MVGWACFASCRMVGEESERMPVLIARFARAIQMVSC